MHGCRTTTVVLVLLTALLGGSICSPAEADQSPESRSQEDRAERRDMSNSSGEYQGHRWHIDDDGLMWWDDKPYVRFAFTGNGDIDEMMQAGFDQFTLTPSEQWPTSGPDPAIVRSVDETSDRLEKAGATYYASLNAFWPWRYGRLITEADRASVFVRDVQDVTRYAGQHTALDLQVRTPIRPDGHDRNAPVRTVAVLFDLQHGTKHDLSDRVHNVSVIRAHLDSASRPRGDDSGVEGQALRVRTEPIQFPKSNSLRLVVAMDMSAAELPGINGLPALWKPGIRQFFRRSLEAFRSAYAKPGLRGMLFSDEINTFPQSLLTARVYLDIREDRVALKAYRDWLARRFGRLEQLNEQFGSVYASFDQVPWQVPLHPFSPQLADTDEAAEREESWAGAETAWELAGTVEQVRTVSRLQDEFRIWLCGHWLAEYARMAKAAIGDVPVFVCSAAIGGDPDQYLGLHRWALREGVDGLSRNHYGHGGRYESHALAQLAQWMSKVRQESGCTKQLWANEVGYLGPHVTDEENAAKEATELGSEGSFGSQWAFPSSASLREMLVLLTRYGYRGFNRFLINPSAARASEEVRWTAQLRPKITSMVVRADARSAAAEELTREQAIAAARADRRVLQLLRDTEAPRTTAEFSERWDVWLVHFFAGDRPLGFASVNSQGKVLEVGGPEEREPEEADSREEDRGDGVYAERMKR